MLAEVPLQLPFTPDSKPPNQTVLTEFVQFSHLGRHMLLDGDSSQSSDASSDATCTVAGHPGIRYCGQRYCGKGIVDNSTNKGIVVTKVL